jgi:hypothetical protein
MTNRDMLITRRAWCTAMLRTIGAGAVATFLLPGLASADAAPVTVTVYKDPSCGCCKKWAAHLSANGFATVAHDRSDMELLKNSLGVPTALRSCHTAVAGMYLIEGHVPAADVKQLLSTKPKGVLGLAVPGMPSGSPGMETGSTERYDVIAFSADGKTRVFATHG